MKWMAAILLVVVITFPAIAAGLFVSPWFFLFCLALMFVPLLFIKPSGGGS